MPSDFDYEENDWRKLDTAVLSQPEANIDVNELSDGCLLQTMFGDVARFATIETATQTRNTARDGA